MNKLRLLIIEDNKDFNDSYAKQIKLFNIDQTDIEVEGIFVDDKSKAEIKLREEHIDAAIVDLKLGNTDVEYEGNSLLELIKNNLRFPAYILTANPEKIEESKDSQNDFLKLKVKGTDEANFTTILNELKEIHLTGITKILGKSGHIEKYLNEIFWKHLSGSVNIWISDKKRTSEEKQKSLLRYTLLHLQEYLEVSEDKLGFEDYHPAEIYITPTVKSNVFTGDIVVDKKTKLSYIVLTPSCDLAQYKAKDILLGGIENENDLGLLSDKINIVKNKTAKTDVIIEAESILKKLINNSYSNKYHFLPRYKNISAGLINFQKINSIKIKDFNENYSRIAAINGSFTKDIIARFSYYYSRQGSPDFDTEEIYNSLILI